MCTRFELITALATSVVGLPTRPRIRTEQTLRQLTLNGRIEKPLVVRALREADDENHIRRLHQS